MNREDIIRLAREAGGYESTQYPNSLLMDAHDLERFAALVAQREREACATVCESLRPSNRWNEPRYFDAATDCAAAIRARSDD